MPSKEEKALDWILENSSTQPDKASDAAMKLGVSDKDLQAWSYAKQNPDDPKSIQARNKIFTKIADYAPIDTRRGAGFVNRFVLKNFADNDLKTQKKFLDDQGIITKIKVKDEEFKTIEDLQKRFPGQDLNKIDAEILRRRPDEGSFSRVEADVIDKFSFADWAIEAAQDITDVSRELLEGGAVAISTIGKAGGPVGAAIGSAIGGAIAGGTEAARQLIGREIGVAEIDPGKIGTATALGAAIPAVFEGGRAAVRAGTKTLGLIPRAAGVVQKAEAPAIKAAAKELGAEATPGQLFRGEGIAKLEESIVKGGDFRLGGLITRLPKQVEANKRAVFKAADDIVSSRSFMEPFEAGRKITDKFTNDIADKLRPAENIYTKYEQLFKDVTPDVSKLRKLMTDLVDDFRFDDEAATALRSQAAKLADVKTLGDLKKFRTATGQILRDKKAVRAIKPIYDTATEIRNDTLINEAAKVGGEVAEQAAKDIPKADAIYRQTAKSIEKSFLKRGQTSKLTPKKEARSFFEKTKEINQVNKILDTGDPIKIQTIKKEFPEAFEILRANKIEQIARQAEKAGEVDPRKLSKIIGELPKPSRDLIFGTDQVKKAEALKTYLDSLPAPFNASNTANMLEFGSFLNPLGQINSGVKGVLLEIMANTQLGKTLVDRTAKGLASPVVKGAAVGGRGLFIPEEEK